MFETIIEAYLHRFRRQRKVRGIRVASYHMDTISARYSLTQQVRLESCGKRISQPESSYIAIVLIYSKRHTL